MWVFVVIGFLWGCLGLRCLWWEMSQNISSRDIVQLHDAASQGVAVAESIRFSKKRDWVRQIKIGAILLEWPSFTLPPLQLLLHLSGIHLHWDLDFSFKGLTELGYAYLSIAVLLTVFALKMMMAEMHFFRFLYPIVFDFLFISLTTSYSRIGLCTSGAQLIKLPDQSTCECLNRYPYFAAFGGIAFIAIIYGSLRYKAEVEHLSRGLDLRLQTSF